MNESAPDDDDHEESIGSPQNSNNNGLVKIESPVRKGFGLKKWRRIKRDGPVKDENTPPPVDGKLLKRGLTGLIDHPSNKHVDISSVEAIQQSSEGSVASVNMVNGFSLDPGFMFTIGQALEHSGNSVSGSKNVGGKIGTIKKASSEERVDGIKTEKPCSSMDSDLRSSDFVFSSVANHGENDDQVREEVQTYSRCENGEESKKNNGYWEDKDQLEESIRSFAALHEALWKEVQSFQEVGKGYTPLHSDIDEFSSLDQQPRNENCNSESQVLILKQKVKNMKHELEEARAILEAKEIKIQELEKSKIEAELEGIFQRNIETEIEHLVITKSLEVLKQRVKLLSLREFLPDRNRGSMLGETCKFGFYFLVQLILLVFILWFMVLQFSPDSRLVDIPT